MSIKSIIAALMLVASATSEAQTVQCLEVTPGSRIELELTTQSEFANCVFLKGSENLSQLGALSTTVGDFSHKLKMVKIDAAGSVAEVRSASATVGAAAAIEISSPGARIGLVVTPTSKLTTNKYLSLSYLIDGGSGSVVVRLVDLPTPVPLPTTTPPPTVPPYFEPCVTDKLSGCEFNRVVNGQRKTRSSSLIATTQAQAAPAQCSAETNIPAGKHPNFSIDGNLAQIAKMREAVDVFRAPALRELTRALVMVELFAPGKPYDLKNSSKYQSTQEFGNYFYGMAAAKMGYTEDQALKAGAVVQQFQNYSATNHPDASNLGKLAANLVKAATTGCCDNPDDPPMISAGHQAGANCETDNSSASNSNGGGGEGALTEAGIPSGWNAGGNVTLPRVCIGACGSTGTVTVGPTIPRKDTK